MAVEEPKFQIVKAEGDFEVRDYPGLTVAEVDVGGDRRAASNEGFRLLAGYIFGGNAGNSKIAMTAPVTQFQVQGRKIAMTAPVTLAGEEAPRASIWAQLFRALVGTSVGRSGRSSSAVSGDIPPQALRPASATPTSEAASLRFRFC